MQIKGKIKGFLGRIRGRLFDNRGITTVEIILILVVLLALVFIFRDQLTEIINDIFENINDSISELY